MSFISSTLNNTSGVNNVPMHDGTYLWFAKLRPYVDGTKTEPLAAVSAIHFHVEEGKNPVPALGNLTSIIQHLTELNITLDGNLQVLLYLAALPSSWEGFKMSNVSNILTLIKNEWNHCSTRQQSSLQSWISGVKCHYFNPNWKKQKKQCRGKKYKGKKKAFESVEVAQASVAPNDFEMEAEPFETMEALEFDYKDPFM
ncbi:hypothetical protein BT96DRAFT_924254, partial [Gymnopus androsaceus JB14]